MREITVDWSWDDESGYAQAIEAGGLLFISGQAALDADGRVVGENDLAAQTRKCFENMRELLDLAGAGFKDVVQLTTYFTIDITDSSVRRAYWQVRQEFFGSHKPTSTGMQIRALLYPSLLLEVAAIAVTRR
jgi:enamine deaminase RidA (YjgF/YER057c/UK114 family)